MSWRPRKVRSTNSPGPTFRADPNFKPGKWQTASHVATVVGGLAQIGLLLAAIAAYIYTVVPIYEKAVLDEEIAKRILELQSLKSQVSTYEQQVADARQHLQEMQTKLASANERAARLYITLRSYVASQAIATMSAACSTPGQLGGDFPQKFSLKNPPKVKVTDNLLASCVKRQLEKSEIAEELKRLSSGDQRLFEELVVAAAREAAGKIEAFLREVKKRELENRASREAPLVWAVPKDLKEDEIAVSSLMFSLVAGKLGSDSIYEALSNARTRQDTYAEIVRTALLGALDKFLKARPQQ